MIPKLSRGDRMAGLMNYLAGPGKKNEHEDIHIVASSPLVFAHPAGVALSQEDAVRVAREMDVPHDVFNVTVPKGHVFHCSLSLSAEEGIQTDERWAEIAAEFADKMGFTETSGKAPLRWVAVRHGLSSAGNDHVHIVASIVREDGTKWSDYNDRPRVQKAAREIEEKFGYRQLGTLNAERGYHQAEKQIAEKRGLVELPRETLQRRVRAAASASVDEAEFVRRLRGTGVLVRPRFAAGTTDVIEGFSVAVRPTNRGERPVWFGGGRLARDLTLPKLRADWPDNAESALAASAEWSAAAKNKRISAPGRETVTPGIDQWAAVTADVVSINERLRTLPITDKAAWAQVARETSGALSAWSIRTEAIPGPLADAARALRRSAQVSEHIPVGKYAPMPSPKGAGMLLMQAAVGPSTAAGQALLLRQMMNTVSAVSGMQQESGLLHQAERLRRTHEGALQSVHAHLAAVAPTAPAGRWAQAGGAVATAPATKIATTPAPAPPSTPAPVVPLTAEQLELRELQRLRAAANGAAAGVNKNKPVRTPKPPVATGAKAREEKKDRRRGL
ncbi:Relaxase [Plantibacter sp. RU18]